MIGSELSSFSSFFHVFIDWAFPLISCVGNYRDEQDKNNKAMRSAQTDLESWSIVAGQRPLPFGPQSQRSSTQSSGGLASKVGTDIPRQKQGVHSLLDSHFLILSFLQNLRLLFIKFYLHIEESNSSMGLITKKNNKAKSLLPRVFHICWQQSKLWRGICLR